MPDLFLRKVVHPQAVDNYRVILKDDETEVEIGSIGTQFFTETIPTWVWAIDTVIPMRELESEGEGNNRKHCMKLFKAAWEKFSSDPARLAEFFEMKRRARRGQ
jgi:glutamate synthase domain-containing protein 1